MLPGGQEGSAKQLLAVPGTGPVSAMRRSTSTSSALNSGHNGTEQKRRSSVSIVSGPEHDRVIGKCENHGLISFSVLKHILLVHSVICDFANCVSHHRKVPSIATKSIVI